MIFPKECITVCSWTTQIFVLTNHPKYGLKEIPNQKKPSGKIKRGMVENPPFKMILPETSAYPLVI